MSEPVIIEGFRCYAPAMALGTEDYPVEVYERICRLEDKHFWFRARNRIILRLFRRYVAGAGRPRVLELGCGTGYVLSGLAAEGRYDLTGAEANIAGLRHGRERLPSVAFVQVDARELPYRAEFDAIGAFDVIEHIAEDEAVLSNIFRALKPGGVFILTVPQHAWLWSSVDENAGHKRRYSRRELLSDLKRAGFEVLHATSFVSTLLPLLYASRFSKRHPKSKDAGIDWSELEISPLVNAACAVAMRVDEALIGAGLSLPAGGSLIAAARKPAA